ncbi:MAG TPA: helix-turn-helix domain-containing protein [Bacteroidales bacterium]|nr:helix-turn-helix domain-containing protein [Bacteroidales bacterium]
MGGQDENGMGVTMLRNIQFGRYLIETAQEEATERLRKSNEDALLTIEEAMALLKVKNRATLWRWEKSGYLIPLRSGKRCLYRKSDIEHLLTNSTN